MSIKLPNVSLKRVDQPTQLTANPQQFSHYVHLNVHEVRAVMTDHTKKAALCSAPPMMKTSPPIMMAGLRPVFSERAAHRHNC